jgi:hypothetical protein
LKLLTFISAATLTLDPGILAARAEPAEPLAEVVRTQQIRVEANGDGRSKLTLILHNSLPNAVAVTIPAGLLATGAKTGIRVIGLRTATATIPSGAALEMTLPVAALSSTTAATPQSFAVTSETEPRLTALLQMLADQPDAPRSTAQLAVFCLMEDVTFARWRQFSGAASESPTPAEVTQAIDALGLLRAVAPQRTFALAQDADLKARALRNPWCRAKAMAVYGLDLGDGALPPDLRQLLHTQAGDNCPICRQRALMQKPADLP